MRITSSQKQRINSQFVNKVNSSCSKTGNKNNNKQSEAASHLAIMWSFMMNIVNCKITIDKLYGFAKQKKGKQKLPHKITSVGG